MKLKRFRYLFFKPSSSSKKIIELRPLLPNTSVKELLDSTCKVVLIMDITGVIPLPAAKARYCLQLAGSRLVLNFPVGGRISSSSPAFNSVFA